MSFTEQQHNFFVEQCKIEFESKAKDSEELKKSLISEITSIQMKMDVLEQKFIERNEISGEVFNKWHSKYKEEIRIKELELSNINSSGRIQSSGFLKMLEKMKDLYGIYEKLDIIGKQRLLIVLFGAEFKLGKEGVGTLNLNPIFMYKANKIKNLYYIKTEKAETIFTSFPLCTRSGGRTRTPSTGTGF